MTLVAELVSIDRWTRKLREAGWFVRGDSIAIPGYGPPLTYWDRHTARHVLPPTLQLRMAVWSGAAPMMCGGRFGMAQLSM